MAELGGGRRGQLTSSGLRPGWTTGACATAGATAAYTALLQGEFPDPVIVLLPQNRQPSFALTSHELADGRAAAAITKDSGDDPDVTHGAVVHAAVWPGPPGGGVRFVAGEGVGTVTLPGLPLPPGEPAINPGPRAMIVANLRRVAGLAATDPDPDVVVQVSIAAGAKLAQRTLNPRLGIVGGLSVLGTTGVVVPYSCSAWIDSIRRGVDVARALGHDHVAGCTGSTSERVARELYGLPETALLDMGDFAGAVLKYLRRQPLARLTICGGVGKLAKLADGHLDLHSARSRVDVGFLTRLAEQAGATAEVAARVAGSTTALAAIETCAAAGVPLGDKIAQAARDFALEVLAGAPVAVDVVCIDRAGQLVGRSRRAGPGTPARGGE